MSQTIAENRAEWRRARVAFLEREKAHTRDRDALAAERRALPRLRIEDEYRFVGPDGEESLSDLFAGRSQLAVYHFMYGPDWDEGCPSCSFWADSLDGIDIHLAHRDISLVLVSSAPFETLDRYRRRMGWRTKWVSAGGSRFNEDFGVTFTPEQLADGAVDYNYRPGGFSGPEAPGFSAFLQDADGVIWHTYSTYARGLDHFNGAYQLMDLMPKGRDEDGLDFTMAWLRRRDKYDGPDTA